MTEIQQDKELRLRGEVEDLIDGLLDKYDYDELTAFIMNRERNVERAARLDELKRADVGKVSNRKNRANSTYMSGFGYAANNLQRYKVKRLAELEELSS